MQSYVFDVNEKTFADEKNFFNSKTVTKNDNETKIYSEEYKATKAAEKAILLLEVLEKIASEFDEKRSFNWYKTKISFQLRYTGIRKKDLIKIDNTKDSQLSINQKKLQNNNLVEEKYLCNHKNKDYVFNDDLQQYKYLNKPSSINSAPVAITNENSKNKIKTTVVSPYINLANYSTDLNTASYYKGVFYNNIKTNFDDEEEEKKEKDETFSRTNLPFAQLFQDLVWTKEKTKENYAKYIRQQKRDYIIQQEASSPIIADNMISVKMKEELHKKKIIAILSSSNIAFTKIEEDILAKVFGEIIAKAIFQEIETNNYNSEKDQLNAIKKRIINYLDGGYYKLMKKKKNLTKNLFKWYGVLLSKFIHTFPAIKAVCFGALYNGEDKQTEYPLYKRHFKNGTSSILFYDSIKEYMEISKTDKNLNHFLIKCKKFVYETFYLYDYRIEKNDINDAPNIGSNEYNWLIINPESTNTLEFDFTTIIDNITEFIDACTRNKTINSTTNFIRMISSEIKYAKIRPYDSAIYHRTTGLTAAFIELLYTIHIKPALDLWKYDWYRNGSAKRIQMCSEYNQKQCKWSYVLAGFKAICISITKFCHDTEVELCSQTPIYSIQTLIDLDPSTSEIKKYRNNKDIDIFINILDDKNIYIGNDCDEKKAKRIVYGLDFNTYIEDEKIKFKKLKDELRKKTKIKEILEKKGSKINLEVFQASQKTINLIKSLKKEDKKEIEEKQYVFEKQKNKRSNSYNNKADNSYDIIEQDLDVIENLAKNKRKPSDTVIQALYEKDDQLHLIKDYSLDRYSSNDYSESDSENDEINNKKILNYENIIGKTDDIYANILVPKDPSKIIVKTSDSCSLNQTINSSSYDFKVMQRNNTFEPAKITNIKTKNIVNSKLRLFKKQKKITVIEEEQEEVLTVNTKLSIKTVKNAESSIEEITDRYLVWDTLSYQDLIVLVNEFSILFTEYQKIYTTIRGTFETDYEIGDLFVDNIDLYHTLTTIRDDFYYVSRFIARTLKIIHFRITYIILLKYSPLFKYIGSLEYYDRNLLNEILTDVFRSILQIHQYMDPTEFKYLLEKELPIHLLTVLLCGFIWNFPRDKNRLSNKADKLIDLLRINSFDIINAIKKIEEQIYESKEAIDKVDKRLSSTICFHVDSIIAILTGYDGTIHKNLSLLVYNSNEILTKCSSTSLMTLLLLSKADYSKKEIEEIFKMRIDLRKKLDKNDGLQDYFTLLPIDRAILDFPRNTSKSKGEDILGF